MKSFIIFAVGLVVSWYLTDLRSESSFENVVAPLGVAFFTICLVSWIAIKIFGGSGGPGAGGAGGSGFGHFGDGDGGGSGGGDGGGC